MSDVSALTPDVRPNAELGFTPNNSILNSDENSNYAFTDFGTNTYIEMFERCVNLEIVVFAFSKRKATDIGYDSCFGGLLFS